MAQTIPPVFHQPALRDITGAGRQPMASRKRARSRTRWRERARLDRRHLPGLRGRSSPNWRRPRRTPRNSVSTPADRRDHGGGVELQPSRGQQHGALGLMQVIPPYHGTRSVPIVAATSCSIPRSMSASAALVPEGCSATAACGALQYYNGCETTEARYPRKVMALKKRLMLIAGKRDRARGTGAGELEQRFHPALQARGHTHRDLRRACEQGRAGRRSLLGAAAAFGACALRSTLRRAAGGSSQPGSAARREHTALIAPVRARRRFPNQ